MKQYFVQEQTFFQGATKMKIIKKLFAAAIIFMLALTACGGGDDDTKTTLTINNFSDYSLLTVEFSSVSFGNIDSGRKVTKEIDSGIGYVYFYLLTNSGRVRCRTDIQNFEEGGNTLNITNNSLITAIVANMTDTLSNLVNKIGLIGEGNGVETYQKGDRGPAGGFIFYDKGAFTDGWRYLEAAPASTEVPPAIWGDRYYSVTTGEAIGDGKRNTELIVASQPGAVTAAWLCTNMVFNGYRDWFLPSRYELDLMYRELRNLGGFYTSDYYSYYWSSSHSGLWWTAWVLNFRNGDHDTYGKDSTQRFRAIRAF